MVPYEKNEFFTGRDDLLSQIFETLCETKPRRFNHRVALYGLGGIGKTQSALAYAYAKRDFYDFIYWISGVNQTTLLSGFQEIASKTGCTPSTDGTTPLDTAKNVLKWLQQQTKWLLVIDNMDEISLIYF